jgi:hypothetical protein
MFGLIFCAMLLSLAPGCSDSGQDPDDLADAGTSGSTSAQDAAHDAALHADAGATACVRSADCAGSPEAASLGTLRCPSELYCLEGTCHAGCSLPCRDIREDVSSCGGGAYCDSALRLCRYKPAKCATAATCPSLHKPLPDGGLGSWTCESGQCVYPGFTYASQD